MVKQLAVWTFIARSLEGKIPVMLLYVVESNGSSPGRQGFSMAVNGDGEMVGSIGGGIMEHKFVEMAKDKLAKEENELTVRKQIHDKEVSKNQSGMICSGEQTIFLYTLKENEINTIRHIIVTLENNSNDLLEFSPSGLSFSKAAAFKDYYFNYISHKKWKYEEKIGYKNHLHIIGSGRYSMALSTVMHTLDFYIRMYDFPDSLNSALYNQAHDKIIINDYSELTKIRLLADDFLVIITSDAIDYVTLQALAKRPFKYIGLVGNNMELESLQMDYHKEEPDVYVVKKVHFIPIFDMERQSPVEIAINIAAEIIRIKNSDQK